jgi:OmcA/MtrC family decaheme c-type cytochrome
MATGVVFPRDLRDCSACHGEKIRPGYAATQRISRRTCSGCHPDTWYGDAAKPITDQAHFAHPGGPQANDAECKGCHVALAGTSQTKLYAPIAEAHVVPAKSPSYDKPRIEIVDVRNLFPGGTPTLTFKLSDAGGPMTPGPADPSLATTSLVPGRLERLRITVAGPADPDYGAAGLPPLSSAVAPNKNALLIEPGGLGTTAVAGQYVYTFASPLPASARGTWAIGMEARRRVKVPHYDKSTDTFLWPFTGETVTESPDNPVVYVDTDWGTWPSPVGTPRRAVVAEAKCLRCHDRLELHGAQRHQVEYCLLCHSPEATDWAARPKKNGFVDLAATVDGVEERSIHLKVMLHRIHTGGRTGAASLEALEPHVIYGYGMRALYFDEGIFPADLANCTRCHEGKSYLVESIAEGAPATVANETATIRHAANDAAHPSSEKGTPPIQAACLGCHANGGTLAHVASKTVSGVETCAQCHSKGSLSVEVAHGLAPRGTSASASFSAIVQEILVPRCATAACHSGSPPLAFPQLDADAAYAALVGQPSQQGAGMNMVEAGAPERSYLLFKLRGDAGSVGGTPATPMPIFDTLLDPADVAAIEAWIANGALND